MSIGRHVFHRKTSLSFFILLIAFALPNVGCQSNVAGTSAGSSHDSTDDNDGNNDDFIKQFRCDTTPAQWSVTPDGFVHIESGEVFDGHDEAIQDLIGADHWSSSSRNRASHHSRGDIIELLEGDFDRFRLTLSYDTTDGETDHDGNNFQWGLDPQTIIRAALPGKSAIKNLHNPVNDKNLYLEWGGAWSIENLDVYGNSTAAIMTENPYAKRWSYHPGFRDIRFCDTRIIGGYDFNTDSGFNTKWGFLSYGLGRSAYTNTPGFIFKAGSKRAKAIGGHTLQGIKREHFFYFHNVQGGGQGGIYIGGNSVDDPLTASGAGRTFIQVANRDSEGPAGNADITLQYIEISDVSLQQGGGGSALSFNGNHTGTITIDHVDVRLGANPDLHPNYQDNITGGFVSWDGSGSTVETPNGDIIIKNSYFQVGPHFVGRGAARRENLQVGDCKSFTLENSSIVQMLGDDGRRPRGAITIDTSTISETITFRGENTIIGDVYVDGNKFADDGLDGSGYAAMRASYAGDPKFIFED